MCPENTKKAWYKHKTIWANIVIVIIALYNLLIRFEVGLPVIPQEIYIILGVLGVKYRASANTSIGRK